MTLDEYQVESRKTAVYPGIDESPLYPALGLCGEAGEVAEVIKKAWRAEGDPSTDQRDLEKIGGELGDVLWYLAQIASEYGLSLEGIARRNLTKLEGRMKNGTLRRR